MERNYENEDYSDENVERSSENSEQNSEFEESDSNTIDRFSLVLSDDMNDQVSQLCEAVERIGATFNSQPSGTTVKLSVAFPVFFEEKSAKMYTSL